MPEGHKTSTDRPPLGEDLKAAAVVGGEIVAKTDTREHARAACRHISGFEADRIVALPKDPVSIGGIHL